MVDALPRISVITPSFNQARFLEATIRSVLEQDYHALEYIVMDGGSTDGSVEIIRKHAHHITCWESEKDRGQSHAINKGLARATGDIVAYLNSDDVYLPGTLLRVAEEWRRHPEAGVYYGRTVFVDAEGRELGDRPAFGLDYRLAELPRRIPFYQCAGFIRRTALRPGEGFREDIWGAMDFEMWLRLAGRGEGFRFIDAPLAGMTVHEASKGHSRGDVIWAEGARVLDEIRAAGGSPWSDELLRGEAGSLLWKAAMAAFCRGDAERSRELVSQASARLAEPDETAERFIVDCLAARFAVDHAAARRFACDPSGRLPRCWHRRVWWLRLRQVVKRWISRPSA